MGVLIKITQIRSFHLRTDRCMYDRQCNFHQSITASEENARSAHLVKSRSPFFRLAWILSCKEARSFLQTEDYGAFGWAEADYAFKHDRKEICKNTPEHFELE